MKIFISHSSIDKEKADDLCQWLEARKISCFLAPRDIPAGTEYAEQIVNGIDTSDAMILLLSENSNKSPHVLREVERAVSKAIPILIYKLEEVELTKSMEYFLMTHQWISCESDKGYEKILEFANTLKKENFVVAEGEKSVQTGKTKKMAVVAGLMIVAGLAIAGVTALKGTKTPVQKTVDNMVVTGDTVTIGSYNNEAIEWRILQVNQDEKEVLLVAKDILTMKAWDAPESGTYNSDGQQDYWQSGSLADTDLELQAYVRGSNDWQKSSIRTWLNSEMEVVEYEGQAPVSAAMSEKKNGYNNEAGFLHGFTMEERQALKTDASGDRVSLLTKEQISLFDAADISLFAAPTDAAIEQDKTEWFDLYLQETDIKTYSYWLKDAVEGTSSQCYLISGGYTEEIYEMASTGLEGYGIRPVITVDLESAIFAG